MAYQKEPWDGACVHPDQVFGLPWGGDDESWPRDSQ